MFEDQEEMIKYLTKDHISLYAVIPYILGKAKDIKSIGIKTFEHAYKPILFIDLVYPEGSMRVAVFTKFLEEFRAKLMRNDLSSFDDLLGDDDCQDKVYRGFMFPNQYRAKANEVYNLVDLASVYVSDSWGESTIEDYLRLEKDIEKMSIKSGTALKEMGRELGYWPKITETAQDKEVYFSFDVVEHKINFCLDTIDPISTVGVEIKRTPLTPELLAEYPEADQRLLKRILTQVSHITQFVTTLREKYQAFPELAKKLDSTLESVLYYPLYRQVSAGLKFNPMLPAGQALVDGEVSKMLTYLEEHNQFFDNVTLIQFTVDEEGKCIKADDTTIADMWATYIESFGRAVSVSLSLIRSEHFRPYTITK